MVAAPLPWVLGIARHKLLDHYRRQGRTDRLIVPWQADLDDRVPFPTPNPGDEAASARALAALAAVPSSQREALVLRYLDHLPVPEIARELGRSVHAVESLLARGRASFRRADRARTAEGD